ncbi:hypothetical protein AVBRAN12640_04585 [Campylobacter sp. RM12640]|uniref:hypothetical protein n=1 Tax=unclassified Campylobacter TaxID=2593542 RepID=UPI0030144285|nr:hypothetical protein [Campylobacter sp. RM12640]MBZ7990031.1 hypothetical protein [Campylobacter sp. RM12635]
MKKVVLAILALGFITNASAYSWISYTNGYNFITWSGAWSSAFNSSARDTVIYNINKRNCKNFNETLRKCLD